MENKRNDRSVRKERSFVQYGRHNKDHNHPQQQQLLLQQQQQQLPPPPPFWRSPSADAFLINSGGEGKGQHHNNQQLQQDPNNMKKERSFVRHSHHHHNNHAYNNNNNNNNNSSNNNNNGREQSRRRSAMPATSRSKPAMELYRPPTLRGPGIFDNANGDAIYNGKMMAQNGGGYLEKPGLNLIPVVRPPTLAVGALSQAGIKRSKSLGSADLRAQYLEAASTPTANVPDLGPFSPDVQNSITKSMSDPNNVSARQLMEVVRHVFTRVVEASRHAEPAARLCISIIEKEKSETFLETLLNTCQEYFQERDRLLRNNPPAPYPGFVPAHPRWIAYMTFLNEMYTQLKRRHMQLMTKRMRNSETPPGLLLLTLLAQCCQVCLKENAVNSLSETECLFFVLTGVGKDIEVELPHQMARVMSAARDAFLTTVRVPAVRKTLLQLIEMHAARWQLPAPAVMYYYPGSGSK